MDPNVFHSDVYDRFLFHAPYHYHSSNRNHGPIAEWNHRTDSGQPERNVPSIEPGSSVGTCLVVTSDWNECFRSIDCKWNVGLRMGRVARVKSVVGMERLNIIGLKRLALPPNETCRTRVKWSSTLIPSEKKVIVHTISINNLSISFQESSAIPAEILTKRCIVDFMFDSTDC